MPYTQHGTEHAHDRVKSWTHQAAELEHKIHKAGIDGATLYAAFAIKLNGIYHAANRDSGLSPAEKTYIETHTATYMHKAGLDASGAKELLHAGEESKLEDLILNSIVAKMHGHKGE